MSVISAARALASPLRIRTAAGEAIRTTEQPAAEESSASLQHRYDTLFETLRQQQKLVAAGQQNGAGALRHVLLETAAQSRTVHEFMQLTQAVFVENSWIPRAPVVATVIPPTTLQQPDRAAFKGLPSTHWRTSYKDMTDGRVNDDDQCHHLVAYMALGYYHGPAAAVAGSYYHKLEERQMRKNIGDINLGILAGKFGAQLGRSHWRGPRRTDEAVTSESLLRAVNALCDELAEPT